VELHHRGDKLREQLMNTARQRALLELSAQFDAERRTREIELLKRGNEMKSAELRAQRLSQLLLITATALTAAICVLLGWAFSRVRKINARLRYNSEHDALTGLSNRHYLREHVLATEDRRQFHGGVLIIDVDRFKQINDSFGHAAGDMVLARLGRRLSASLRTGDTLVRWGGEEFLAILPPMTETQLGVIADKLLDAVRNEPLFWHGDAIRCTVSIGYASFPFIGLAPDVSLSGAISLVDKALYHAKRCGRDRACSLSELRILGITSEAGVERSEDLLFPR
jgi:diguanylate cyclase (GGDEF)-like protein